jgi:hypothetical protein
MTVILSLMMMVMSPLILTNIQMTRVVMTALITRPTKPMKIPTMMVTTAEIQE